MKRREQEEQRDGREEKPRTGQRSGLSRMKREEVLVRYS